MRVLESRFNLILHVSHVSGLRMIAQGGDGVSRGILNERVMAGKDMLSFIPLDKSALERSDALLPWIQGWTDQDLSPLCVLSPEDWFTQGHDIQEWERPLGSLFSKPIHKSGCFGWFPPPAAADVAL
jgi:hypothetical protein